MKINKVPYGKMHNAEHFQYGTEVKDLITQVSPIKTKIAKFFAVFFAALGVEDICLLIIQKSNLTELLNNIDRYRDSLWKTLVTQIESALKHFDANVVAAAKRLKIVADTFGNLAYKPKDEETSGITNFAQEVDENYAADIVLIGAAITLENLKESNAKYDQLSKERDAQSAEKPDTKMKEARVDTENAYREMTTVIEAFSLIAETQAEKDLYNSFITHLNVIIDRYKNRISQREGVAAAKREKEGEKPEIITSEDFE